MSSMRRVIAVLAAAALLAPLAAPAGTNPILRAAKRTAAVKSSTLRMSVTTRLAGRTAATMTGSGVQQGSSVELTLRQRIGTQLVTIDAVLLTDGGSQVMYMRSPVFTAQLPAGKSWVRVDLTKQAAGIGVDLGSVFNAAETFAPLEHGVVSVKRLGRQAVAGAPATHYRAIVDVKRAARAVPAYGEQVAAVERATGVTLGRSPYDVWVGGDGRIRQMRFTAPTVAGGVRGTSTQTITFLSYNRPVTISAPPRAQVFSP
jgi:hypothetical protein